MNISGKVPRWLLLTSLLVGGVIGIVVPSYYRWQWDDGVAVALGQALIVAAVLGLTIERWFRQDFAKDVFYGAVGEVLRPEFRDELRWVASFQWLALKSHCHIKIEDLGDGAVRLTMEIEREIENITSTAEKIHGYIGVDEWQVGGHKSSIEACGIQKAGQAPIHATIKEERDMHLSWSTEEVSVEPGERIKAYSKAIEYRHRNDIHVLALTAPTRDPEVKFEISDTLQGTVSFTHRGKMEDEPLFHRRVLRGTFLPSQLMIVRWWPKAQQQKS